MRTSRWSRLLFLPLVLMVLGSSCPTDDDDDPVEEAGALVGMWDLIALNADYNRVVALTPAHTAGDSFSVSVRWDLAPIILGVDSAQADLHLFAFYEGDVLLDTLVALPTPAHLAALGVQLTGNFLEGDTEDTYTLSGTYPTLRTDMETCRTALAVPSIQDAGSYEMNYITESSGFLTITPSAGDQVLPPFDNAPVTFSGTDGNTLQLDFTDLDAHDTLFPAAGHTWVEADLRGTMGVADLPIDATTGAFAETGATLNDTAYIMSAELAAWGGYMTFYALTIFGEAKYLALAGLITDAAGDGSFVDDAIGYMVANLIGGMTQSLLPYSVLVSFDGTTVTVTNDSGTDATVAGILLGGGGKLKFVVNAVCVPINEVIEFESTWAKMAM